MVPNNFQALVVILLAIVPGFLATTFWARTKTWRGRGTDLWTILQSLAISLVIQILASPLTIVWLYPVRTRLDQYPVRVAVWLAIVALIVPALGGIIFGRLGDVIFDPQAPSFRSRMQRILGWAIPPASPPTIWDWLFTANVPEGSFLIVEFTDGHRIAGIFAEGSTALTSPEPQGLFLSAEWSLDEHGDLAQEVPGSAGVIITSSTNIRSIRILQGSHNV